MGRWLSAALLALVAGCGSFTGNVATDPNRTVLGVGADQPQSDAAAVLPATTRQLAFKESQICTRGYLPLRQDVEPAGSDRALIDWQLRCKPYQFALPGIDFAGVIKY